MATPAGWVYEITDVNDTGGSPATFSNSNTWVGSGQAASFYTDFFDNAEFLAAYVQRPGGGSNITTEIDRITIEGKLGALASPNPPRPH